MKMLRRKTLKEESKWVWVRRKDLNTLLDILWLEVEAEPKDRPKPDTLYGALINLDRATRRRTK